MALDDDKVKLDLLVEKVEALNERVQFLSHYIRMDKDTDDKINDKIKVIDDKLK